MAELLFSVVDREGKPLTGALVRFWVGDKIRTEGAQQENPFSFKIDPAPQNVDVEIFFGKTHKWVKVPMSAGTYNFELEDKKSNRVTIIGALIAAVATITVGYWQFVYKPNHADNIAPAKQAQLRIVVRDESSSLGIRDAHVRIEDGSRQPDDTTDGNGSTRQFAFLITGAPTLRITVDARQYESTNRNLDRPTTDQTYTIALKKIPQQPSESASGSTQPSPKGTWDIEASADPSGARISRGTFTFVPQGDGSILVSGHFLADKMEVTLNGTAGQEGRQIHTVFKATTSEGGSWNGSADFTFVSAKKMTGRVQSKRGDDIGVELLKP
jgi:hypothetical protein